MLSGRTLITSSVTTTLLHRPSNLLLDLVFSTYINTLRSSNQSTTNDLQQLCHDVFTTSCQITDLHDALALNHLPASRCISQRAVPRSVTQRHVRYLPILQRGGLLRTFQIRSVSTCALHIDCSQRLIRPFTEVATHKTTSILMSTDSVRRKYS